MPKGYQNGAQIDAKHHQQSMPQLVPKRIGKTIKNNTFPIGEIKLVHHTIIKNLIRYAHIQRERQRERERNIVYPSKQQISMLWAT